MFLGQCETQEHYPAEDQVGGAREEASCSSRKPDGIKSGFGLRASADSLVWEEAGSWEISALGFHFTMVLAKANINTLPVPAQAGLK